jgi:hypothetical protein
MRDTNKEKGKHAPAPNIPPTTITAAEGKLDARGPMNA